MSFFKTDSIVGRTRRPSTYIVDVTDILKEIKPDYEISSQYLAVILYL